MSRPSTPRTAACAVLLAAVATTAPALADEPRTAWEYRCIDAPRADDAEVVLNHWGDAGWELCATLAGAANGTRVCFKRPRAGAARTSPCKPACGSASHCVDGQCLPCRPACLADEVCTPAGACAAKPGRPEPVTGDAAGEAIHWQPTREEFSSARAILQPTADRCAAGGRDDGSLVVTMTILGNGTVTAARAGQTALGDDVRRCIEDAARALRFRPFRAALIAVDVPMQVKGRPTASASPSKLGD